MLVLGIETSCDETGVALFHTRDGLLAQALHSQIAMHREYGGVVPELASRDHIRRVVPLVEQVLASSGRGLNDVGAIAATHGPGLSGALLVGAATASALAYSLGVPSIAINHLEGHLLSPLLADPAPAFPFVALLVSGGHTQLLAAHQVGRYELLGDTLDDAAGEAFDKSAKLMGLTYPGGPALAALARSGRPARRFRLPRPMLHSADLDFSFSGLKTAVMTRIRNEAPDATALADLAAEIQEAITEVLAAKAIQAVRRTGIRRLVVAGGVSANQRLRERLLAAAGSTDDAGFEVYFPPPSLCSDNGAMIALAGALRLTGAVSLADMARHDDDEIRRRIAQWQLAPSASGDADESGARWSVGAASFAIRPRWPLHALQPVDGAG